MQSMCKMWRFPGILWTGRPMSLRRCEWRVLFHGHTTSKPSIHSAPSYSLRNHLGSPKKHFQGMKNQCLQDEGVCEPQTPTLMRQSPNGDSGFTCIKFPWTCVGGQCPIIPMSSHNLYSHAIKIWVFKNTLHISRHTPTTGNPNIPLLT